MTRNSQLLPQLDPRGTQFLAANRGKVSTAAVVGDHHLIGVMGAESADIFWPPDGKRADVDLDEFRYASNSAVLNAIDEIDLILLISPLSISTNRTQFPHPWT